MRNIVLIIFKIGDVLPMTTVDATLFMDKTNPDLITILVQTSSLAFTCSLLLAAIENYNHS